MCSTKWRSVSWSEGEWGSMRKAESVNRGQVDARSRFAE
jgi:hypothetical protein